MFRKVTAGYLWATGKYILLLPATKEALLDLSPPSPHPLTVLKDIFKLFLEDQRVTWDGGAALAGGPGPMADSCSLRQQTGPEQLGYRRLLDWAVDRPAWPHHTSACFTFSLPGVLVLIRQ